MANLAHDEDFLKLLPTKWWLNFFKKFDQINTLPVSEWKPYHLLAYFSHRFQEYYGNRFSFTLKGRPSSCPEIYQIKQVIAVLGTDNPVVFKEYIDWIFDTKIIPMNRKIRSLGFINNAQFCNEFSLYRKEAKKKTRTTELPEEYMSIIHEMSLSLQTYGDLAFVKQALDDNPKGREIYSQMFNRLYAIGFEFKDLEGLK